MPDIKVYRQAGLGLIVAGAILLLAGWSGGGPIGYVIGGIAIAIGLALAIVGPWIDVRFSQPSQRGGRG